MRFFFIICPVGINQLVKNGAKLDITKMPLFLLFRCTLPGRFLFFLLELFLIIIMIMFVIHINLVNLPVSWLWNGPRVNNKGIQTKKERKKFGNMFSKKLHSKILMGVEYRSSQIEASTIVGIHFLTASIDFKTFPLQKFVPKQNLLNIAINVLTVYY